MTTLQQKVQEFMDNYFFFQIKKGQMKWELELENGWLTIYFEETLTATGNEKKFTLLCSQALNDYSSISERDGSINFHSIKLLDRIHTMLFENLRSIKQDVNILMSESK